MIRFLLFTFFLIGIVSAEELFVTKNANDFVIEGKYTNLNSTDLSGSEFWICVDYEASTSVLEKNRVYPTDLCGGKPETSKNLWWYAIHGQWTKEARLTILFEGASQVWPESGFEYPGGVFTWARNVAPSQNNALKLIQSHGVTNYGAKDFGVDMVDLVGSGSVHVRGPADGVDLHVRVNGIGFTLQQAYETENARTNEEENVIVDNDSSTTIEPFEALEKMPMTDEQLEGVQSRPVDEIPVFGYVVPLFKVYDEDSGVGMSNETESEIAEIEVKPQENNQVNNQETTTIVASIKKSEVEATSVPITSSQPSEIEVNSIRDNWFEAEAMISDEETEQEKIIDYQFLYTVAVSIAFAFLIFFVAIVLFRCATWGRTGKLSDLPATVQTPRPLVYTIGDSQRGNAMP